MSDNFILYVGIEKQEIENFREIWDRYIPFLPAFPNMIQNIDDSRAAVFNTWIRYVRMGQNLVVKPNRTFSHSIVQIMSKKLQTNMPQIALDHIIKNVKDEGYVFIYSYTFTRNLLLLIEQFMEEHAYLQQYAVPNYYLISDVDLNEESELNLLIKEINYGFTNQWLTEDIIKRIYIRSIHETTEILMKIK